MGPEAGMATAGQPTPQTHTGHYVHPMGTRRGGLSILAAKPKPGGHVCQSKSPSEVPLKGAFGGFSDLGRGGDILRYLCALTVTLLEDERTVKDQVSAKSADKDPQRRTARVTTERLQGKGEADQCLTDHRIHRVCSALGSSPWLEAQAHLRPLPRCPSLRLLSSACSDATSSGSPSPQLGP